MLGRVQFILCSGTLNICCALLQEFISWVQTGNQLNSEHGKHRAALERAEERSLGELKVLQASVVWEHLTLVCASPSQALAA